MASAELRDSSVPRPVWAVGPVRFGVIVALDAFFTAAALGVAYLLRFEGSIPADQVKHLYAALPCLLVIRTVALLSLRLHRWSFRMSGLSEGARLAFASLLGTAGFIVVSSFVESFALPRSVLVLEFFIATTLMGAFRFAPRLAGGWYIEQKRSRDESSVRALIIGAGSAGDLLSRDILRDSNSTFHVLGFLDDDRQKAGTSLNGKPVLGTLDDFADVVKKHEITTVLIAIPRLAPERIRSLLRLCETQKVSFKIIPASFAYLDSRITTAMLHDLSPEDLLPRDQVSFDEAEFRGLISGRRIFVTGAGGSIGSEISRQLARHEPAQLTLVDLNENELYLLTRSLQQEHPQLTVNAVVADIRDRNRIDRLGQQFKPHYVFHAAAHKHVPLMEDAPEEAVKNNIFGTQNVAKMADACGAEKFVLISTDKAVMPSSVMGASKRVAELIVRDIGSRSKCAFTAVRFGNVLGSAGSVVPLFKQQIARGGPVTITHPECTRYFMTIPEAVGLVLLAGLGGYGELCILDMGEPIRIAELASNMITMAGLVPGKDIPVVFTGLRPGEKLAETLLTDEEEQSQQVRNRILVAKSPLPSADLHERLERLRRAAEGGEQHGISLHLKALVPSYVPAAPLRLVTPPEVTQNVA